MTKPIVIKADELQVEYSRFRSAVHEAEKSEWRDKDGARQRIVEAEKEFAAWLAAHGVTLWFPPRAGEN